MVQDDSVTHELEGSPGILEDSLLLIGEGCQAPCEYQLNHEGGLPNIGLD